jgi:hypothetical protein
MPTKKRFDIFISHNSIDKPWAIKLKGALESQGLRVWLDKDQIRPGDLFVHALEEGIEACKCVAIVVSPESMESGWVYEEYSRALVLANTRKQQVRLIPLILRTAKLPGFLSSRNWVDFRDEVGFAESVKKLAWGITGLKEDPVDVVEIPFVVAAMTKQQALALFQGKLKSIATVELKEVLFQQINSEDLINCYSDDPDDWKFPLNNGEKISIVIRQTLEELNLRLQTAKGTVVYVPKFETNQFLSNDKRLFDETMNKIKHSGCVLVIDALSLFHEDLAEKIRELQMETSEVVATVVMSPLDAYANPIIKIIEKEVKNHLQLAFQHYAMHMDRRYEIGVSNLTAFRRWIYSAIPEMSNIQKAQSANREYIRRYMGAPTGIEKLIFGSGESK